MLCEAGVKPLETHTLVSHPSAPLSRLTKRGDTVPPFLLSVAKRQPVVTQAKAKIPAICIGDIFGMSLVSEAALASSQNCSVVLGGLLLPTP